LLRSEYGAVEADRAGEPTYPFFGSRCAHPVTEDGKIVEGGDEDQVAARQTEDEDAEDDGKLLSHLLVRDLTAHRLLGLRLALGEQPDVALIAVTHTPSAQTFYRAAEANCLDIRPASTALDSHADGIGIHRQAKPWRVGMPPGRRTCRATWPTCGASSPNWIEQRHSAVHAFCLADRQCGKAAFGSRSPASQAQDGYLDATGCDATPQSLPSV